MNDIIVEKLCLRCLKLKSSNLYFKDNRAKSGLQTYCKECMQTTSKTYKNKTYTKQNKRRTDLWEKYKLTLEDYNQLLVRQENKCKLCKSILDLTNNRKAVVDHCHKTGKVRGILCNPCNVGLGRFKDSPEVLALAIDYLNGSMK